MFLQSSAVEISTGAFSFGTFILALNLTFRAGRIVEKVDNHEKRLDQYDKRLDSVEKDSCPAENCPMRAEALDNKA